MVKNGVAEYQEFSAIERFTFMNPAFANLDATLLFRRNEAW